MKSSTSRKRLSFLKIDYETKDVYCCDCTKTIMRIKAVVACPCSWDVDINADTDWVSR